MTAKYSAVLVGAYEHPGRHLPDTSHAQIHAEAAMGAVADAGLTLADVDGYFCSGDAPGFGGLTMANYMGLKLSYLDVTEMGGSSYVAHVGHAAAAINAGKCKVALITLGGKPRTGPAWSRPKNAPEYPFEDIYGLTTPGGYALAARRHMAEFGTTSEQLAAIKVAASKHAKHNPNAFLPKEVTVEEVLESPMISDPLHRLDCCVVTDGGGALVLVHKDVAKDLDRQAVSILGHGETIKHTGGGNIDLTFTGARWSGPRAFEEAGIKHADIDYASIYDSFTITVLETIEDLGFCEKGKGGQWVLDGALEAPYGKLPFNTDGGGLCNNHPTNRGGITKVIEAVRQLRGEANAPVQVPDCEIALVHGTGGSIGNRMGSATLILGRESA